MDGGDIGTLIVLGLAWLAANVWNDTRTRYRCGARKGTFGRCREKVGGPGMRCTEHISRRARSFGP